MLNPLQLNILNISVIYYSRRNYLKIKVDSYPMDQLVVLQEIFESYMRGGFSRAIDPKSISGDCANLVAALLESFEEGQIDEKICTKLLNCLSDIYDIKRLGDICRLAGHLGTAARCYNKALSTTQDQHVRYVLLNNLGQVHARQGYLGRALHYYERAAEGFSDLDDVGSLAHVLGNMGSAYRSGENYDKAIESCRKSLEIFKDLDDEFGVAQMTGSLGRIYAEMGDFDLALQYYEKSLKTLRVLEIRGRSPGFSTGWVGSTPRWANGTSPSDTITRPWRSSRGSARITTLGSSSQIWVACTWTEATLTSLLTIWK